MPDDGLKLSLWVVPGGARIPERGASALSGVPGNISVHVLERQDGPVTHFITMTFWDSMMAICGFAGDDVQAAKYYPDRDFLLEYEPNVVHCEVVNSA